jgi:hypothetical protein
MDFNDLDCRRIRGNTQAALLGCLTTAVMVASGCQCWGPSATCLRSEGAIVRRADTIRQQHLERSHYYRDVPMFEQYLDGAPETHQQIPSRFHPVPTRNVFQSPLWSGETGSVIEREYGQPPVAPPGRIPAEELPAPKSPVEVDGTPSFEGQTFAPNPTTPPLEFGPQASSDLLHRELIQYPHQRATQQRVADWVQGNYVNGTKESLRLHSALRTGETDGRYR